MWLLEAGVWNRIEQAIGAAGVASAQQQADYEANSMALGSGDSPRVLTVAGNSAEVTIIGVLTPTPNFFAALFGGGNTTYAEINAALAAADRDDNVEDITLAINSPGGSVEGLFETLSAIEAVGKPITAVVHGKALSAAYAIASKAGSITAASRSSAVGSIGVVQDRLIREDVVSITSTNAPDKRPDVTTEEGKAVVRKELDAIEGIFIEAIASGRGVTNDKVIADFGKGSNILADDALKRGMIDSVADSSSAVTKTARTQTALDDGAPTEAKTMDLDELKAKHPALYTAAKADGAKEATSQERDRVTAHLEMGTKSGDMKTALAAVGDGSGMTLTLQAKYMSAGMDRSDVEKRQADDAAASAADGADNDDVDADKTASDSILSMAAGSCGVDLEGVTNA